MIKFPRLALYIFPYSVFEENFSKKSEIKYIWVQMPVEVSGMGGPLWAGVQLGLAPRGDVRRGQSCPGPTEVWAAGGGVTARAPQEKSLGMEGSSSPLPLADPWQRRWKPDRALAGRLKKHRAGICDCRPVDAGPHQSRRAKDPPVTTRGDHSPGQPNLHAPRRPARPGCQALSLSLGL